MWVLALALIAQDAGTATAALAWHVLDAPPIDDLAELPLPADDPRRLLLAPDLALRLSAGGEWDTNARRLTSAGDTRGPSDGVVRIVGDLRARLAVTPKDRLALRYVVGIKRFFDEAPEDLLVHDLSFDAAIELVEGLDLDARGRYRASRIRNRSRDYALYSAGGGLSWRPLDSLTVSAEARVDALDFEPTCLLSYAGPAFQGALAWRPVDRVELGATGGWGGRTYDGRYDPSVGLNVLLCTAGADRRQDNEPYASLHATYRGAIIVGGEVLARISRSNDDFENIDRYRVSAWATVPMPLDLVLSASGALQFNRGTSVSSTLRPVEDDENQTGVELQLTRPIAAGIEAIVRYALYANAFATAPDEFIRHTVYGGLSYEIGVE